MTWTSSFSTKNQACPPPLWWVARELEPSLTWCPAWKTLFQWKRCWYNQHAAPRDWKTFQGYAADVFVPYVTSHLQHVDRLNIVWNLYMADSLKADTRSKRGKGVRRRVKPSVQFLETGKSFSALTTRRSYSPSWLLTWQTLTPTNISSPHKALAFFAPIARTCQL